MRPVADKLEVHPRWILRDKAEDGWEMPELRALTMRRGIATPRRLAMADNNDRLAPIEPISPWRSTFARRAMVDNLRVACRPKLTRFWQA
jgi:hypothetical protein